MSVVENEDTHILEQGSILESEIGQPNLSPWEDCETNLPGR